MPIELRYRVPPVAALRADRLARIRDRCALTSAARTGGLWNRALKVAGDFSRLPVSSAASDERTAMVAKPEENAIVRLCELGDKRYAGIKRCLDELLTVLKSMEARLSAIEEELISIGNRS